MKEIRVILVVLGMFFISVNGQFSPLSADDCIRKYSIEDYLAGSKLLTNSLEDKFRTVHRIVEENPEFPYPSVKFSIAFCSDLIRFSVSGGEGGIEEVYSTKSKELVYAEPFSDGIEFCDQSRIWRTVYGSIPKFTNCQTYDFSRNQDFMWSDSNIASLIARDRFTALQHYLSRFGQNSEAKVNKPGKQGTGGRLTTQ
jgi:hypothetical protein